MVMLSINDINNWIKEKVKLADPSIEVSEINYILSNGNETYPHFVNIETSELIKEEEKIENESKAVT